MINEWAEIKTITLILTNQFLGHYIIFLILVDASESEGSASSSFIRVSLEETVDNTTWSSFNISGNSKSIDNSSGIS